MKIDRLIGILALLLQRDKVTAPELAERFEVSRRTINRDIEALCKAGIPIATTQGAGGGIHIMDGYRVDRTLLTSKDMQMIIAGLRSLDSVSGNNYYGRLMEKLQSGASDFISGRDSILIDLASWYKDSLAPKIETIQAAIEEKRELSFAYYAPGSEGERVVEPYYLIFRWSSWYLWGWCRQREAFRLFKLNRMEQVRVLGRFPGREVPVPEFSGAQIFQERQRLRALFAPEVKWRLVEEYGIACFQEQEDGRLLFQVDDAPGESLISWLLTFGDQVEVLEPEYARRELARIASRMVKLYQDE